MGIGYEDLTITQSDAGAVISAGDRNLAIVANAFAELLANESDFAFV